MLASLWKFPVLSSKPLLLHSVFAGGGGERESYATTALDLDILIVIVVMTHFTQYACKES